MRDEEGQNLVEFALLLPILMYILMGIMQFGLIFVMYISLNNAVREGARYGSIYVYDNSPGVSAATNDTNRLNAVIDTLITSRGVLSMAARGATSTANYTTTSTWGGSGDGPYCNGPTSCTNSDTTVTFSLPTGITASNARRGEYMAVQTYYHLQVFMPLLQQFLPDDPVKGAPWIRLPGTITVVIN